MSEIDKQALREAAANAKIAGEEPVMPFDQRITALNDFMKHCSPATVLALLDELEAAEKRIAELESGSQAQKLVEAIIVAIENEQERLFDEDYLMDSKECIDVIREEVKRWNDSRAAGIRIKGE
ncbi:ead/Ea22-like family protein [Escherichia coli]|nr:ead/Ea22-like family protein [Escherichia coli]